jgi:hypothetical protein
MREKYYSEKEVQDALAAAQKEFKYKFCPAANSRNMCDSCHSYQQGSFSFYENSEKKREYLLTKPWCTCALVTGIIEVDGI